MLYISNSPQYFLIGFICPTQTPEGENTGLYNQLASQCKVRNFVTNFQCENIFIDWQLYEK